MMLCIYSLCCGSRVMTQDLQHGEIQDLYSKKNPTPTQFERFALTHRSNVVPNALSFSDSGWKRRNPLKPHACHILALPLNWHMINR